MQGVIRVGLSSWLDKSLLECDRFYPPEARDAESRLRYYAAQFPQLVEVDSTFYALPAERNAYLWSERTPADFVFDVKIYGLFTLHPALLTSLPKDIRQRLDEPTQAKERLYFKDVPAELAEAMLSRFVGALRPLHERHKLGAILLQFPRWFNPGKGSQEHLLCSRSAWAITGRRSSSATTAGSRGEPRGHPRFPGGPGHGLCLRGRATGLCQQRTVPGCGHPS